jgi:hypothetical protein
MFKRLKSMKNDCKHRTRSKTHKKHDSHAHCSKARRYRHVINEKSNLSHKKIETNNLNAQNHESIESKKNLSSLNQVTSDTSSSIINNLNDNDYDDIIIFNKETSDPTIDTLLMGNFTLSVIGSFINNTFKNDLNFVKLLTEQAYIKIRHGFVSFETNDITLEDIIPLLFDTLKYEVNVMSSVMRTIPEFSKLDSNDFSYIIKNKFLVYTILKYHKLKINSESYNLFTNGLQCTRAMMNKMGNVYINNMIFQISDMLNELNLNEKEFTALMTFVLSFPRNMNIKELNKLIEFNQLVGKILANEVFTSKRDQHHVAKIRNVICNFNLGALLK